MKNASTRYFLDTNILAYAYDARDVAKRERAAQVLDLLANSEGAAISTQVAGELFRTLTRANGMNLPYEVAEATVLRHLDLWTVLLVEPLHVVEALRGVRAHQLPYYDALIWATARLNGIPFLLSEDGQDGRVIDGVRVMNPLAPDFDLDLLA